jgi:hypothetical protein
MTDAEMDALEARAKAAPAERCCYALAELGQHAYGCDRQQHPARIVVPAREIVWLLDEVRLRRERDSLLLDRSVYRDRLNRTEAR